MFRWLGQFFWRLIDAIGATRRRITDPFERFIGVIFRSAVSATGSSNSFIGRIGSALFYPIERLLAGLIVYLRWVSNSELFGKLFRFLSLLAKPISMPFAAVLAFISAFYYTRSRRLFWLVLPLSVLTLVFVGLIFQVRVREKSSVERRYRSALSDAIETQDFNSASLYREKLRQLESETDRIELQQATHLLEQGNIAQAYAIVEPLASSEGISTAGAHFWLAVNLLEAERSPSCKPSISREEAAKLAISHIEKAYSIVGRESSEGVLLNALALLQLGRVDEANNILLPYQKQNFSIALLRFRINLQINNRAQIVDDATALTTLAEKDLRLLSSTNDTVLGSVFTAERLLKRWPQAEEIASIWYTKSPKDRNAIESLILAKTNRFEREWASASSIDFESLADLAVEIASSTTGTGKLAVTPLLFSIDLENNNRSREFIEVIRSRNDLPGEILAFLGTSAASKDQFDTARRYLSRAIESEPSLQTAWNNYAYVLDKGFPEEIATAKTAADKAVMLDPQDVHARDTRADIFIRIKDWRAAITDLKVLTNASFNPKSVHSRLAIAYRSLGDAKLALVHERLAEKSTD